MKKEGTKMNLVKKLWKEEEGQGLTEYAVVLVAIVGIVIAALVIFGDKIKTYITNINFA